MTEKLYLVDRIGMAYLKGGPTGANIAMARTGKDNFIPFKFNKFIIGWDSLNSTFMRFFGRNLNA